MLAGQSRLVVIPVRVEDVQPDEAFAYEFATRQWIDMFDDWERSMQRLVRQLSLVAGVASSLGAAAGERASPAETDPPWKPDKNDSARKPAGAAASAPSGDEADLGHKGTAAARSKPDWRLLALPGVALLALGAGIWAWVGHPINTPAPAPAPTPAVAKPAVAEAMKQANEALDRKDYAAALRWSREAADQGNAVAQRTAAACSAGNRPRFPGAAIICPR